MSLKYILRNIEKFSENIFVSSSDGSMTFNQFRSQVHLLKNYIHNTVSVDPINIGILVRSKSICCELYIATLEAGHSAAIMDFGKTQNELDQYINTTPISLVICSRYDRSIYNFKCSILYVEDMVLHTCSGTDFIPEDIYGDTIVQTSGASGKRKTVRLSTDNLVSSAQSWGAAINFSSEDTYIHALELSTIGGLAILWRSLLYGFAIYMTDSKLTAFKKINKGNLIVSLVPTMLFDLIKEKGPSYIKGVDIIVLGGEPLRLRDTSSLSELNINIFMAYGMTETSSGVMGKWIVPEGDDEYIPFSNVSVMTVSGRVYIYGPMIASSLLSSYRSPKYLMTDDSGYINSCGVHITGRSDRTIVSGGKKINPSDIERIISEITGVINVSVYPENDDRWGQIVVASVVVIEKSGINKKMIDSYCRELLSAYKLPKKYYIQTVQETS